MSVGPIQSFMIENETYADDYLTALFEKPEYRSMDVVRIRAAEHIKDQRLRNYFINKATELLRSCASRPNFPGTP
jgi:hypothetical protein